MLSLLKMVMCLCDVAGSLNNCAYYTHLDDAVGEVIKTAPPGSFVYRALVKYLCDKRLFQTLFPSHDKPRFLSSSICLPLRNSYLLL